MPYPQLLPSRIRAAIRQIGRDTAISTILEGNGQSYPIVILVTGKAQAVAWAGTKGLVLGARLIADYTPHGATLGIEIEVFDQPDSSMKAYTLLNPDNYNDVAVLKKLAASPLLAVGFADLSGSMYGAKTINWPADKREEVAQFSILGMDHNKQVKTDGLFDYAKAIEAFDKNYTEL